MSQLVSSKLGPCLLVLASKLFHNWKKKKKTSYSHIYLLLQMFISFLPASFPHYNLILAQISLLRGKNWKVSQPIL